MNSCIYVGQVRHRRFTPHEHTFNYRMFMMYLDLDELPDLFSRFWLWSYQGKNIASFQRDYYYGDRETSLQEVVRQLVEDKTGSKPAGPIRLFTHMRYFGYQFNPVSFYYCFNSDGKTLHSIVSEINNTPWNEKYCYVHKIDPESKHHFRFEFDKQFHVSPFNSMNQHYDWRFDVPDNSINTHMSVLEKGSKSFDATMTMKREEINSLSLAKCLLRFPLMTMSVVARIYYQAFRLWLKRTPVYDHPVNGLNKKEAPNSVKPS